MRRVRIAHMLIRRVLRKAPSISLDAVKCRPSDERPSLPPSVDLWAHDRRLHLLTTGHRRPPGLAGPQNLRKAPPMSHEVVQRVFVQRIVARVEGAGEDGFQS